MKNLYCVTCLLWGLNPTMGISAVHYETGKRQSLRQDQLTSPAFDEHKSASGEPLQMTADTIYQGTAFCAWHFGAFAQSRNIAP